MKSVNKAILIGTLGRDPEVRSTPNGTNVAKFSIATNERYKDRDGEWQDRTEWHNIVCWQRLAEIVRDYTHKGDRIYIEGRLQTSSWDDKQTGEKKYRTEVIASDLVLIGGKGQAQGGGEAGGYSRGRAAAADSYDQSGPVEEPATGITDDDIPF
ncbi:MAG TPA: single-stranded DNA-binding protein [Candidatus Nanoarchaeia archaeon]|nr:single-stranded DNA-binding protein [Candidatus Nanoarchaeia archaeon]